MYDKVRLLETLEEHTVLRHQREEEKRRIWEQKRLREQFAAKHEALFGSKPSPMQQVTGKKPLGQSSNANMVTGTLTSRCVSTPWLGYPSTHRPQPLSNSMKKPGPSQFSSFEKKTKNSTHLTKGRKPFNATSPSTKSIKETCVSPIATNAESKILEGRSHLSFLPLFHH
ncbi:65-kDa microtubule-associated protein 3-like [Phoenix dactylifera]|uniref:65-kDa microtubule-associated protein 3-like n=1 Tax=Phoenix dactylifera TaxID=42345 RepID=A0A8B8ZG16_PHODC|nr:65-kDa microtubule-associated protein 3-like [Phoenix dactylifera]